MECADRQRGLGVLNGSVESSPTGSNRRDRDADEREAALDVREAEARAREMDQANRQHDAQTILVDAGHRDDAADARDVISATRDQAADLEAFLNKDETYVGHGQRRAAAVDRSHAKDDREAAAGDRIQLTEATSEADDSSSDPP